MSLRKGGCRHTCLEWRGSGTGISVLKGEMKACVCAWEWVCELIVRGHACSVALKGRVQVQVGVGMQYMRAGALMGLAWLAIVECLRRELG